MDTYQGMLANQDIFGIGEAIYMASLTSWWLKIVSGTGSRVTFYAQRFLIPIAIIAIPLYAVIVARRKAVQGKVGSSDQKITANWVGGRWDNIQSIDRKNMTSWVGGRWTAQ